MFDDPNLHWGSYGYVKYREMLEAAKAENYHASFATVPMDAWFVHAPTARLFRENPKHLSFLIHGNNHTLLELHQPLKAPPIPLVAQALNRVSRFERKSGVKVSRVMAAPHGACSQLAAEALRRTGYDAACISTGSLMSRNPDICWPACVGMRPAECFARLPVIPRFSIEMNSDVPARLAGFLGQPLVPVGHHDDLRAGLSLLSRSARLINSIGNVQWMDMSSIAEQNYFSRVRGRVLEVRMYSRRVRISVPAGVTQVAIHRPWLPSGAGEDLVLETTSNGPLTCRQYDGQKIDVVQGDVLARAVDAELANIDRVRFPRPSIHAIVRRQLCEARDRLRPTFDRFSRS